MASSGVSTGKSRVAAVLVALGGVAAVVGSLITWAVLSRNASAGLGGQANGGLGGGQGARRSRRGAGGGIAPSASPSTGPLQRARRGGRLGRTPGQATSLTVRGLDTSVGKIVLGLAIAVVVVGVLAWIARAYGFRLGALAVGLVAGVVAVVLSITELFTIDSDILGPVRSRLARAVLQTSFRPGIYLAIGGSALAFLAALAGLVAARGEWATGPRGMAAYQPYPPGPAPGPASPSSPTERLPMSGEHQSAAPTEQIQVQPPPSDFGHLDPPPAEPAGY